MLGRLKGDEARGWGQGQHKGWDIGGGGGQPCRVEVRRGGRKVLIGRWEGVRGGGGGGEKEGSQCVMKTRVNGANGYAKWHHVLHSPLTVLVQSNHLHSLAGSAVAIRSFEAAGRGVLGHLYKCH